MMCDCIITVECMSFWSWSIQVAGFVVQDGCNFLLNRGAPLEMENGIIKCV